MKNQQNNENNNELSINQVGTQNKKNISNNNEIKIIQEIKDTNNKDFVSYIDKGNDVKKNLFLKNHCFIK